MSTKNEVTCSKLFIIKQMDKKIKKNIIRQKEFGLGCRKCMLDMKDRRNAI